MWAFHIDRNIIDTGEVKQERTLFHTIESDLFQCTRPYLVMWKWPNLPEYWLKTVVCTHMDVSMLTGHGTLIMADNSDSSKRPKIEETSQQLVVHWPVNSNIAKYIDYQILDNTLIS